MADESSNDASVVAITSDEDDDKPIKKLFKRLINNDCKQDTILTNYQILDLLKVECDVNVLDLHNLELDIYITLIKKHLKDWPMWDEFDRIVNEAKKTNDLTSIDGKLQLKYENLKTYMRSVIETAEPLAKQAVVKMKTLKAEQRIDSRESDSPDVVMEVLATRNQLNTLFLRNPSLYSMFHSDEPRSTILVPGVRKMESILNWWNANIEIYRKSYKGCTLIYKREIAHEFKHVLLNRVLPINSSPTVLDDGVQIKTTKKSKYIEKSKLMRTIDDVATDNNANEVLEFLKKDIFLLPQTIFTSAYYKRHMNGFSYVRYLYKNNIQTTDSIKYDLQLEETILPRLNFFIGIFVPKVALEQDILKVECGICKVWFEGPNLVSELRQHFEEHCKEPPWTCTNCQIVFPMLELSSRWWSHQCVTPSKVK